MSWIRASNSKKQQTADWVPWKSLSQDPVCHFLVGNSGVYSPPCIFCLLFLLSFCICVHRHHYVYLLFCSLHCTPPRCCDCSDCSKICFTESLIHFSRAEIYMPYQGLQERKKKKKTNKAQWAAAPSHHCSEENQRLQQYISSSVCVCVCVWERERDSSMDRHEWEIIFTWKSCQEPLEFPNETTSYASISCLTRCDPYKFRP